MNLLKIIYSYVNLLNNLFYNCLDGIIFLAVSRDKAHTISKFTEHRENTKQANLATRGKAVVYNSQLACTSLYSYLFNQDTNPRLQLKRRLFL